MQDGSNINLPGAEADEADADINAVYHFFNELGIMEQLVTTQLSHVLPASLNKSQFGVLNHMVRLGRLESPAQLASAFQVKRPSMTNTLQKLEAKGFVEIQPNEADGRGKVVKITQQGIAARAEALQALAPLFEKIRDDLGTELFEQARPLLERVRIYLDENR
ncbi:MarR family winged helix-turn-helix transcriptional regulator [Kordiimonas aquimaris]|uniref:MarR family winged helix-turn-helix transcriptional regulator n=1 Tax=Kordiimonas aquimaris TaxID=707591 RepID=UPI0021D0DDA4|nr:MarR family transcriptional regulator [Kordiimonas aquimaris]